MSEIMRGVERQMKRLIKEYEKKGMRKSPFHIGKYNPERRIILKCK